ncbi:MAG: hypothetical protein AVDCRST_MAG67-2145, partial [uncultured Solirubrobacteraceae bacterium]
WHSTTAGPAPDVDAQGGPRRRRQRAARSSSSAQDRRCGRRARLD